MEHARFDRLVRSVASLTSRRGLLGLAASLPLVGPGLSLLDPDAMAARKRRGHHRDRRRDKIDAEKKKKRKKKKKKKACTPQPPSETCAGTCGSVINNCKQAVDCGACACSPACGPCQRCAGTTCVACDPCCDGFCCDRAGAICHRTTGSCCVPNSTAQTCDGQCGAVVNNCGETVDCGPCSCTPACPACQICNAATGVCIADPTQQDDACGPAQTCENGTVTPQGACNGSGTCMPGTPAPCDPYTQCDGNACAATCGNDTACVNGFFCNGSGQCVADLPNGDACGRDRQCDSGHCVDDVCCDTACDGVCQACNVSGSVGTCSTEANGTLCGGGDICCGGACQECCSNGQCGNPTPICAAGSCVACSGANPCPGGEVCCGGSCFAGVCCETADCVPAGNACVGRQCFCGSGGACNGPTPDCCGDPGGCTNTDTDAANCGTCGTTCGGATPTCFDGSCVCDVCPSGCPFASVQAAIDAFPAGGTISICDGTYGRITITKNITLIGAGVATTILDGGAGGRVVFVGTGVAATMQNLRITNGRLNNGAGTGAGILNNGTLTMTGCTVDANVDNDSGGGGGGIQNWLSATLTMINCTVSNNTAVGSAGGIGNFGTVTMTNSAISANHANQTGGGLTNGFGGTVTLIGTNVTGNTSGFAPAGIRSDPNGNPVILSGGSTVSGNTPGNCSGAFTGAGCAP